MLVRRATETDLPRINELRRQVNELHVQGKPEVFKPGFGEELQQYLYTLFGRETCTILVADTDGEIAGFAILSRIERAENPYRKAICYLDVDELCVDAAHRRQGVGRALMAAVSEEARAQGIDRVELNMWEFNEEALRFYEALGFRTYRRYMEFHVD